MLRLISISDTGLLGLGVIRWYWHSTLGEVSTRTRRKGNCVLIDLDYVRRPRLRPPYSNTCPAEPTSKPARKPRAKGNSKLAVRS